MIRFLRHIVGMANSEMTGLLVLWALLNGDAIGFAWMAAAWLLVVRPEFNMWTVRTAQGWALGASYMAPWVACLVLTVAGLGFPRIAGGFALLMGVPVFVTSLAVMRAPGPAPTTPLSRCCGAPLEMMLPRATRRLEGPSLHSLPALGHAVFCSACKRFAASSLAELLQPPTPTVMTTKSEAHG